jgi:hypothetical protein
LQQCLGSVAHMSRLLSRRPLQLPFEPTDQFERIAQTGLGIIPFKASTFHHQTAQEKAMVRVTNRLKASKVSGLTWCSMPSASILAVSILMPIAHRNDSTM